MNSIIKISVTCLFSLLKATIRKFKIAFVACICGLYCISIGQCSTQSVSLEAWEEHRTAVPAPEAEDTRDLNTGGQAGWTSLPFAVSALVLGRTKCNKT